MSATDAEEFAPDEFQPAPMPWYDTTRSPQQGELVAALCKARPKFGPINKDTRGTFGKYASLEGILDATLPALNAEGVDLSFDTEYSGERCFKICRLDHKSGQWRTHRLEMEIEPPKVSRQGKEINNKMQMIGIASSYSSRYVVMDALAIRPDEEDSDRSPQRPPPPPRIDAAESGKLADEIIGKMTEAQDAAELTAISKAEVTPQVKRLLTPQDLKSITNAFKTLKAGTAGKEK